MSLQIGNDKIEEIYYGSDKIKEVYYGSELVYDGAEIDAFYINATGNVGMVYFIAGLIRLNTTTQFPVVSLSQGMNTFLLPVTASTPTGSTSLLNEGDSLNVFKGTAGAYQLVGSIVLAKGQIYNLTF